MKRIIEKSIMIKTKTNDDKMIVANGIHEQLVGNIDYIDSRIVLNCNDDCQIGLYICEGCVTEPKINININ